MSDPEIIALREDDREAGALGRHRPAPPRHRRARRAVQVARRCHGGAGRLRMASGRNGRQRRMPIAARRCCTSTAAAMSSARLTAIAIWSRRSVARRGRAHWPSTIGLRRNIRFLPRWTMRSPRIASCWPTACSRAASPSLATSAGGGLVVAAMLAIRDAGLPQPACGWAISPWVDMEAIGDSMISKAAADPTVQKAGILDMAKQYLNGADPRSPLAAPIYADLRGLAPLLIQVGAAETLLDDAIRLAQVAGAADVAVDLADLAGNDPRVAHLSSRACGRATCHRSGWRICACMTSRGTRSGF